MTPSAPPPAQDQSALTDTFASCRYFATFERITAHLLRVASVMQADGDLSRPEIEALSGYVQGLSYSFRALSMKYLLAGRDTGQFFGSLSLDAAGSGFPLHSEFLVMANDAAQAARHLRDLPGPETLRREMVEQIISEREIPTRLQFALSQRFYYEELERGHLFWAQNDPELVWLSGLEERRRYLLHWAVYDSQVNLPTLYLMEVEDSGRTPLARDDRRWPQVQAHLMGQSLGGLKLLTIARGFDESFDRLHPKRLRRFHVGPFYSDAHTRQSGPLRSVLSAARAPEDQDWALAWTEERLDSERSRSERAGWFGAVQREVFALDPYGAQGAESGASDIRKAVILPERPYQVLTERAPPGFAAVTTYVVSRGGRVLRC
ncbi:MAG: hypothetical protein AAF484_15010 [Pseudomonadota bacterium]